MQVAYERLIINELGSYMAITSSQAGQVMQEQFHADQTAHEDFDLIIHIDIKTSRNENFSIIRHKTIYFLDQEYM